MSDHLPTRPAWLCGYCATPWPCPTRQRQLVAEHDGRRSEVGALMATIYPRMRRDLPHEPAEVIYGRLFGWLRAPGQPRVRLADVPRDKGPHDR